MSAFALVALGAILAYGVYNDGGAHRPEWLYCLVAFGILGAAYAAYRLPGRPGPPAHDRKIWWLLAAVVLICTIQLLPLPNNVLRVVSPGSLELYRPALTETAGAHATPISVVPSLTYRYTLNLLGYILVFGLISDLTAGWKRSIWGLAGPLITIGLLEALVGFLQATYAESKLSVSGTYANRNHFAGLLEMCLPFAVMLPVAVWRRKNEERDPSLGPVLTCCFFIVVAALMLIAIVESLSRMGFIATLLSLFVIAVAAQAFHGSRESQFRWRIAFAALIVLGFFLLPSRAFIARFGGALTASELSSETRGQVWADTLKLVVRFPVFGCGYGAFQSAFMRYQTEDPLHTVNFVHNDYLELATELGIPAFAALLTVAIMVYRRLFRNLAGSDDEYERCFYVACLGSITAITIHSLTDFNLYMPANALVLSWVSAMAAAPKPAAWQSELLPQGVRRAAYRNLK